MAPHEWFGTKAEMAASAGAGAVALRFADVDDGSPLGNVVFATVPCSVPIPLPWVVTMAPGATSITVPAGIFTNRQARYTAHLSVTRFQGTRQGSASRTWSVDLTDRRLTEMGLSILGGTAELEAPRIVVPYSIPLPADESGKARWFLRAASSPTGP